MDDQRGGLIVVGVDGSPGSDAALDFALAEALSRGCAVEVVTGWLGGIWSTDGPGEPGSLTEGRSVNARAQDAQLKAALGRLGATPTLSQLVVHDYAGRVLVARSEHASMVVVSGGSQGSDSRKTVGSVAEYLVRHSSAPVVVVPDPARVRRRAAQAPWVTVAAS
jgi:nucleotide-binding universal stress UspA family protein